MFSHTPCCYAAFRFRNKRQDFLGHVTYVPITCMTHVACGSRAAVIYNRSQLPSSQIAIQVAVTNVVAMSTMTIASPEPRLLISRRSSSLFGAPRLSPRLSPRLALSLSPSVYFASLSKCSLEDADNEFYTKYTRGYRSRSLVERRPSFQRLKPLLNPKLSKSPNDRASRVIKSPGDVYHPHTASHATSHNADPPRIIEPHILPKDYMLVDCLVLIVLISRMLRTLINLNDVSAASSVQAGIADTKPTLTRYHSRTPPSISARTYLERLSKFNHFNPAILLTTIYYIDLLSHQYRPFFTMNSYTVHRFLLVASMVAQKSMEDYFYTNDHYAKVGGVAVSELNCLELDFLERVDWRCIPSRPCDAEPCDGPFGISPRPIRNANHVLSAYYTQLIELTGKADPQVHYTACLDEDDAPLINCGHSSPATKRRRYSQE